MALISQFKNGALAFGDATPPTDTIPILARCDIDAAGNISNQATAGNSLCMTKMDASGAYTGAIQGEFKAERIWNAVWNDIADFQKLDDRLEFGRCYFDTPSGAKICTTTCQASVIGIASDTLGMGVGSGNPANGGKEVPIAVAGWTLAFVDKDYSPGTPLTNDAQGGLTKMGFCQRIFHPERLVAIYKKRESASEFGSDSRKIKVNGRHWVKVK